MYCLMTGQAFFHRRWLLEMEVSLLRELQLLLLLLLLLLLSNKRSALDLVLGGRV